MKKSPILRWGLAIASFLFALIIICALVLRFYIFPNIDQYKTDIANMATKTLKREVSIGDITTGWNNFTPRLSLSNVNIYDENHRPALTLNKVDTEISWLSLGVMNLRLSELTAYKPELIIRRDKNNVLYIAGMSTSGGSGDASFANWLIKQAQVNLKNASITYIDEFRGAPPLALEQLNFSLSSTAWHTLLGRHHFNFSAIPSIGTKKKIEAHGYFVGDDANKTHQWYGEISSRIKETDLSVWKPWLDLPVNILKGIGSVNTYLQFGQLKLKKLKTKVKLSDLKVLGEKQNSPITFKVVDGEIEWDNQTGREAISTKNLNLSTDTGLSIKQANGLFLQSHKGDKEWVDANFSVAELSINAVKKTLDIFELPEQVETYLAGLNPKGHINNLKLRLAGPKSAPSEYQINAAFDHLSVHAFKKMPGFNGLSGEVDINDHSGQILIDSKNANLDFKDILRWPIPANHLQAHLNWQQQNDQTVISIQQLQLDNDHLSGGVTGSYTFNKENSDVIDITGDFKRGNAEYAKFYYPTTIGEGTIRWLDKSIIKGDLSDIKLRLKGRLDQFPFVDENKKPDHKKGIMQVDATMQNGEVKFADSWPAAEGIAGTLSFKSKSMNLNFTAGHMLNQQIVSTDIDIPDLSAQWPILTANGITEAPVKDGIHYINNSPVKKVTLGFTDTLETAGDGRLELSVNVPLKQSINTTFNGRYQISDGTLFKNDDVGMPELSQVNGVIAFDDAGISAKQIQVYVAGGPAQMDISSAADKTITINAKGLATDSGLKETFDLSILGPIKGQASWDGKIIVKKPTVNITINSDLYGMAIDAPTPLAKEAEKNSSFTFKKIQSVSEQDTLEIQYEEMIQAKIHRIESDNGFNIKQGLITVNQLTDLSATDYPIADGIALNATLEKASLEEWLDFIKINQSPDAESNDDDATPIKQANIDIEALDIFGRPFNNTHIIAKPNAAGLAIVLNGQEVAGKAQWDNSKNGKITAKLDKLIIPEVKTQALESENKTEIKRLSKQYPALDLDIKAFQLGQKKLGQLSLIAFEDETSWIIQKLNITNPDNTLTAEGTWHNWTRNPNTYLHFNLESKDVGNTLVRFNQPGAVKGGTAQLSGTLQWPGSPHQFDAKNMNGDLSLTAKKGQILKVKPGVGRLLGLISLQSLPRRLTLDFRDLFSEGFAFDRITANAIAKNGVLQTDDFEMEGPAAFVSIAGETNLKAETQHLNVKVEPHVSDSLSLAALAGGPLAGAAAFLAQKLLKDPLNKIVSTEYIITGTWDNPQEAKAAAKPAKTIESPLK